jgi:tetratricopeptide (TPR) repeat protein
LILQQLGRSTEALIAFREALALFELINYPFGVATSYSSIGNVCGHMGRFKEGYDHLELGLRQVANRNFREARLCEGYLLRSRGELNVLEGKFAAAEESYDRALSIFKEGYIAEEAEVTLLKGRLYRLTGRPDDADEMIRQAIALASKVGYAQVALEGARLLEKTGPTKAVSAYRSPNDFSLA